MISVVNLFGEYVNASGAGLNRHHGNTNATALRRYKDSIRGYMEDARKFIEEESQNILSLERSANELRVIRRVFDAL